MSSTCENGHLDVPCFEVGKFIRNCPPTRRSERCLFIAAKIVSMATKVFKQIHHRNLRNCWGPYPQSISEGLVFLLWSKLRSCHTLSWEVPRRTPSRQSVPVPHPPASCGVRARASSKSFPQPSPSSRASAPSSPK